jgi:large subunit ribosomal protein L25
MKTLTIKAEKRTELGKAATRKLRNNDRVPGVLYGGEEVLHFHMFRNDLRHLLYTPEVFFVDLDIDGEIYRAIKQEVQFHPVTDKVIHMDFIQIFDEKPVVMSIPLKIEGQSVGVKKGGVLKADFRYLLLKAKPALLPEKITVDISPLDIGDSIKVGDLTLDNVEFLERKNVSIVGVVAARGVAEGTEEGEEGEGEEGGDAEASENAEEEKSE